LSPEEWQLLQEEWSERAQQVQWSVEARAQWLVEVRQADHHRLRSRRWPP